MPGLVATAVAFLMVAGWLTVLTSPSWEADAFGERHLAMWSERWPGSVLVSDPVEVMGLMSGLFGVFLLLVDPTVGFSWRAGIYRLVTIIGSAVVALGIVQRVAGAKGIFWRAEEMPIGGAFFSTFFEEEAGLAFATLVWAMAAGGLIGRLGVGGKLTRQGWAGICAWAGMVLVGWLALAVTGSLTGLAIGGGLMMAFVAWVLWRVPSMILRIYGIRAGAIAAVGGVMVLGVVLVGGRAPALHSPWVRLQAALTAEKASGEGEERPRFAMRPDGLILSEDDPSEEGFAAKQRDKLLAIPWRMLPHTGLLGFGPGSWARAFPHFTDDALLRSYYLSMQFAHNDYRQALVEWGVLGTLAWGILFFGGMSAGWYRLRRYRSKGGRIGEKEGMVAGAMAGLCGVLAWAWWSFPLQIPAIQLYVAVVLGLLWSAGERQGWSGGERLQDVIPKPSAT